MDKDTARYFNEIIHELNNEIILYPNFADAYCTRGILKYCLRDINGAFDDWSTAVSLGCKNTILLLEHLTLV